MKITTEMTHAAYQTAKDVYHERMNRNDVLDYLNSTYDMNKGSASDYIVNFKKMMNGEKYTRTNNAEATDYFLTKIFSDYGVRKLSNAIKAVNEHVDYYENLVGGNLNGIRTIVAKHEEILSSHGDTVYPDELEKPESLFEGVKKTITVNQYERSTVARSKCLSHHGYKCAVCLFDFEKTYGEIGKNYIHVHHIIPISEIGKEYKINSVTDLIPVCPNCHAMLHRKKPPYTIEELKLKKT